MATKNLKKLYKRMVRGNKKTSPEKFPTNWEKVIKFVLAKDLSKSKKIVYNEHYLTQYMNALEEGYAKKVAKSRAKAYCKTIIAEKQSRSKQESVQSESKA